MRWILTLAIVVAAVLFVGFIAVTYFPEYVPWDFPRYREPLS